MASSEAVVVASIVGNGEAIEDKSSTFIALGYDEDNDKYYYSEQAASIFHYNKKYRVTPFSPISDLVRTSSSFGKTGLKKQCKIRD